MTNLLVCVYIKHDFHFTKSNIILLTMKPHEKTT